MKSKYGQELKEGMTVKGYLPSIKRIKGFGPFVGTVISVRGCIMIENNQTKETYFPFMFVENKISKPGVTSLEIVPQ